MSERREKGVLGDGQQGRSGTEHHHTWSTKLMMKTVSHREDKMPPLCLGGVVGRERILCSAVEGLMEEEQGGVYL